jgi:hypothetical protein
MTGPEHYAEAERLLEETGHEFEIDERRLPVFMDQVQAMMARAQVHATLALAAATALAGVTLQLPASSNLATEWNKTIGFPEVTP